MTTDAHLHLSFFKSECADVLKRARARGVNRFFCASASPNDWDDVLEISFFEKDVVPFLGTHPKFAALHDNKRLEMLLTANENAKIGEIGLDALHPNPFQEKVFKEQLETAARFKRPCAVHCVKAFNTLCPLLKKLLLPPTILLHGFSGSVSEIPFLTERGAYFSFSGASTYPDRAKAHKLIKAVPLDRLTVETDAPDMMPPVDCRFDSGSERNLPENLPLIIRKIAAIKEINENELKEIVTRNALRFEQGCL